MRIIVKSALILVSICSVAAVTHAVENETESNVTKIGEPLSCIDRRQMKRAEVIDGATVNFIMRDDTVYRNMLLNSCDVLRDADRFSYKSAGRNQLCRGDRMSSLETIGNSLRTFGSCSLGSFQEIEIAEKSSDN